MTGRGLTARLFLAGLVLSRAGDPAKRSAPPRHASPLTALPVPDRRILTVIIGGSKSDGELYSSR